MVITIQSFSCPRIYETVGPRLSTTLLRKAGPYRIMRECAILADGALCYLVIGFVRIPCYARGHLQAVSYQIPSISPLLVALPCYSNIVCLM